MIGLEESLKHWAQQVQVSPESASDVLIGALGMLEAHYALSSHRHLPSDILHAAQAGGDFALVALTATTFATTVPQLVLGHVCFKCYYRRTLN